MIMCHFFTMHTICKFEIIPLRELAIGRTTDYDNIWFSTYLQKYS